jgi:hypothetical protein
MNIELIPIELDKPRTMALPLPALWKAQKQLDKLRADAGQPIESIFQLIVEKFVRSSVLGVDLDLLMVLLWASLIHEDRELTFEQVTEFQPPIGEVFEKLILCAGAWLARERKPGEATEVGDATPPLPTMNGGLVSGPAAESTSD